MGNLKKRPYCFTALEKHLRSEICGGGIPADMPLSSEALLRQRFHLSRVSVRKALSRLKQEGLIYSVRGKGTFVASPEYRERFAKKGSRGTTKRILVLFFNCENKRQYQEPGTILPILSGLTKLLEGRGFETSVMHISKEDAEACRCAVPDDTKGFLFLEIPPAPFFRNILGKYPCVGIHSFDRTFDCSFVRTDNFDASFIAVKHLYDLGHRRIGYFTVFAGRPQPNEKVLGYNDAMRKFGIVPDPAWSHISYRRGFQEELTRLTDYSAEVRQLIAAPHPPTAIITQSNYHVRALKKAFESFGWNVPRDISLIGAVNNASHNIDDNFTTVDCRSEECCYAAARLLTDIADGACTWNTTLLVRPQLIVGSTTAPPQK